MRSWVGVLALLLLSLAAPVPAQITQNQPPPGIDIRIEARPQEATIGDPIQVLMDISHPEGYQVLLPDPPRQLGDFAVLEFNPGPDLPTKGQASGSAAPKPQEQNSEGPIYRARWVVAVYKTGDFTFPPVSVKLRSPDGKEAVVSSAEVKIRIHSILPESNPTLKELKQQADIQEPVSWLRRLGLAALLLALGAAAWWLWRRRRRGGPAGAPPRVDPLDLAASELRNLAAQGLLEKGMVKQYHVALSQIAKMILEGGYGVQTVEKTTCEIMDELRVLAGRDAGRGQVESAHHELETIEAFLSACDLVKFAKYAPTREESILLFEQASELLQNCRALKAARLQAESSPMPGVS